MDNLTNKIALVTGASRGIGAAIAIALAKAGCDVAVNYRNRGTDADAICATIRNLSRRALSVQADVSQTDAVGKMVAQVQNELGPIDILVNNAGIGRQQKIEDITEADWNELIDVNLKSAFLVSQAVLPSMRRQKWGRILNISSVAAQVGGIIGPHYAASKAGMLGLTRSWAYLLVKEGITSNAIAPALIETEMVTSNLRANRDLIPVGRFGNVEEAASLAVTLIGNGYITGQTVNINGGWYFS
jgi:3-oxoacyl-[acyl-carrier protein] reductase